VPLGRNSARPSRTVRAWPAATRGTARVRGLARPTRSTRGAWRHCMAAALLGEPTAARCRRAGDGRGTGAHRRGDDSVAWRRRASSFGQDGGTVGEAVGVTARSVRRSGRRRHAGGGRGDGGAREAGRWWGGREGVTVGTHGTLSRQRP
jgi:hypothetical protein